MLKLLIAHCIIAQFRRWRVFVIEFLATVELIVVLVAVFVFVEIEFILVEIVLFTGEHEYGQVGLGGRQLIIEVIEIAVAA